MPTLIYKKQLENLLINEMQRDRSHLFEEHECEIIAGTYANALVLLRSCEPVDDCVRVVHCKDCAYGAPHKTKGTPQKPIECKKRRSTSILKNADDFCSMGVRKDGGYYGE